MPVTWSYIMECLLLADSSALGYQIHDSELMGAKFFRRMFRIGVKSHLMEHKPKNMV